MTSSVRLARVRNPERAIRIRVRTIEPGTSAVQVGATFRPTRYRKGRVFVVSSPSGGGKTTVVERLRQRVRGLVRSVSVTTRSPRQGERQGRDYRFVTPTVFQQMKRSGQLLEWAEVHKACYGTPREPVIRTIEGGKDVILNIDVQGARKVRRTLRKRAVLIFLLPPSMEQLKRRLVGRRTETPSAIRQRLAVAKREIACAKWYDHQVVNDHLETTIRDVEAIIMKPRR